MVQPVFQPNSDQEHTVEESNGDAVHPPLGDLGIQTDTWNSVGNHQRRNSNADGWRYFMPGGDDLEGAVGYSAAARAMLFQGWGYGEEYSGSLVQNRVCIQRRHSSGEPSGTHGSQENYAGHSRGNQFGPGDRRASTGSGYGVGVTEVNNTGNLPEVLNANHNHFVAQYIYPPGIPHETVILGTQLYTQFLYDQIQRHNLQAPESLDPNQVNLRLLRNNDLIQLGETLRQVANEFARSRYRHVVRQRAESVCLESLNIITFSDLLFGLFQEGGVTRERVVVLFFFCSDLAIRALQNHMRRMFDCIILWSQQYIMRDFSVWVQEHGGWAAVLQQSVNNVYKCAMIGFCCMASLALFLYIRKNIR